MSFFKACLVVPFVFLGEATEALEWFLCPARLSVFLASARGGGAPASQRIYYSSFHFIFHYPHITPMILIVVPL